MSASCLLNQTLFFLWGQIWLPLVWNLITCSFPLIFYLLSWWFLVSAQFSSVQFSRSVMSDSLRLQELHHARPPWPSPTPRVHSNSHPSSRWCHPAISSSVVPFSNESTLRMRWPKYWSFSFSIIPSKEPQDWSPLEQTGWISLQSKGLSRVFSNSTVQKHRFFVA